MEDTVLRSPDELLAESRRLRGVSATIRARPVSEIVRALGSVGERFLDPKDVLRREARERLSGSAGLSSAMADVVLDGMAADWTTERLRTTLEADFPDPHVLDGFVEASGRTVHAVGAELTVQIVAGGVPGVGVNAMMRALLVKSPTLIRPGRGDEVLSELAVCGLSDEAAWLADAVAIERWDSGDDSATCAAVRHAGVVTVYGSDATVSNVRGLVPAAARVVPYHHRLAVVVIGPETGSETLEPVADRVARSIALFEQRGCVCPHFVYVSRSGVGAERFAEALAEAMGSLEAEWPTVSLEAGEAAALQQLRGVSEMQTAAQGGVVRHGGPDASWTVIYEPDAREGPTTFARGVRVRAYGDERELIEALSPHRAHLQSVGVTGMGDRRHAFALELGRLGATRIVDPGQLSFPPPWWLHDGRRPLEELVRWVELEGE